MSEITIDLVEKKWSRNARAFVTNHNRWESAFNGLVEFTGDVLVTIAGRRRLAENCSYLLLSKSLNHAISAAFLSRVGMQIDAALCARNGFETALFLELSLLSGSDDLFERWSNGESFRPVWVRERLEKLQDIEIGNLAITRKGVDAIYREAYKWLSDVTHANLDSLNYTTNSLPDGTIEVITGGETDGQGAIVDMVFASICFPLIGAATFALGVFDTDALIEKQEQIDLLRNEIEAARGQWEENET